MHMMVNVHFPLVPQTGQTLPLVSHGNTSFLVFSAVFGILLSISRQTWLKMSKREAEAIRIVEPQSADEVQAGLNDLDTMETANQQYEDYGV
jgi:cell division protein FtsW